ncbi:hypothetical protein BRC81_04865 [Halobacteriales archaeon QS_1_68_20]|nr:MAG: hypothetical protein BRC81_04865 [Halobacteriales archaeon QS_1_68_20]
MAGEPIEGEILLLAGAKSSLDPSRVSDLVDVVQAELGDEVGRYRREFERVHRDEDREAFLAVADHWETVGERLGFDDREVDAVRRAHTEQLRRLGRREGRLGEFETALEIRDAVIVGV